MSDIRKDIGNRIKQARKGKFTQQGLADQLGLSRQAVIDMEVGKTAPKSDTLGQLALALGKTTDWIVLGDDPIEGFVRLIDGIPEDKEEVFLTAMLEILSEKLGGKSCGDD